MNTEGMQAAGVGPEGREDAVVDASEERDRAATAPAAQDDVHADEAVVDDETVNEPEAVTAQHEIIDHLPEQLEEATIHWHAVGEFLGSALSALRGGDGWDDEQSPDHGEPAEEETLGDRAAERPEGAADDEVRRPAD